MGKQSDQLKNVFFNLFEIFEKFLFTYRFRSLKSPFLALRLISDPFLALYKAYTRILIGTLFVCRCPVPNLFGDASTAVALDTLLEQSR